MPFENWEDERQINWRKILLGLLLIGIVVGAAVAVYKITSPPSEPVIVVEAPELAAPTFNATSLFKGETLQITVKLTPAEGGVQIFFYENNNLIGSATTNSDGDAILNRVMNIIGTFSFTADAIVSP